MKRIRQLISSEPADEARVPASLGYSEGLSDLVRMCCQKDCNRRPVRPPCLAVPPRAKAHRLPTGLCAPSSAAHLRGARVGAHPGALRQHLRQGAYGLYIRFGELARHRSAGCSRREWCWRRRSIVAPVTVQVDVIYPRDLTSLPSSLSPPLHTGLLSLRRLQTSAPAT